MTEAVHLEGLLFTDDTQVSTVIGHALDDFGIRMEIQSDVELALEAVRHRRLDAVLLDWSRPGDATRIARAAGKSFPNTSATIVAMVNQGSETHALLVGAHFMLFKPLIPEHARRCIRAAYGTMLDRRRRAGRVPVDVPGVARIAELGEMEVKISDLSLGGFALECGYLLPINTSILTRFSLPGTATSIQTSGTVVNANGPGRAGVRFSYVSEVDLSLLEDWLAVELAKLTKVEMPGKDIEENGY